MNCIKTVIIPPNIIEMTTVEMFASLYSGGSLTSDEQSINLRGQQIHITRGEYNDIGSWTLTMCAELLWMEYFEYGDE